MIIKSSQQISFMQKKIRKLNEFVLQYFLPVINIVLFVSILFSLIIPFFVPFFEIPQFLIHIEFYSWISLLIFILISIKFFVLFFLFKYKGEQIEEFLFVVLLANFFNYLNLASGANHFFINHLLELNNTISYDQYAYNLLVIYFRTFQFVFFSFTFQGTNNLLALSIPSIQGYIQFEVLLSILYSLTAIFLFSFLTIYLFASRIITKMELMSKKDKMDRFFIFTDQDPEDLLNFIGDLKSKRYIKVFVTESSEYTRAGQDYRKQLEFEKISVISVNLTEENLKAIYLTHQTHLPLTNLFISYYKQESKNRAFAILFKKVLKDLSDQIQETNQSLDQLFYSVAFEKDLGTLFKQRNHILSDQQGLFNFFMKNRILIHTNPSNYFIDSMILSKSKFLTPIDFTYVDAYMFLDENLDLISRANYSPKIKKVVYIFVGKGGMNFHLNKMVRTLLNGVHKPTFFFIEDDNVEELDDQIQFEFCSQLKEGRFIVQNELDKQDIEKLIDEKIYPQYHQDSLVIFFVDIKANPGMNDSLANSIRDHIKHKNNLTQGNNSLFLVFDNPSAHSTLDSETPISKSFIESFLNSDANDKDFDIHVFPMKRNSTLQNLQIFTFKKIAEFTMTHLVYQHQQLPLKIDQQQSGTLTEDQLDQAWQKSYELLLPELPSSQPIDYQSLDTQAFAQALAKYQENPSQWHTLLITLIRDIAFHDSFTEIVSQQNTYQSFLFLKKNEQLGVKKLNPVNQIALYYWWKIANMADYHFAYETTLAMKVNAQFFKLQRVRKPNLPSLPYLRKDIFLFENMENHMKQYDKLIEYEMNRRNYFFKSKPWSYITHPLHQYNSDKVAGQIDRFHEKEMFSYTYHDVKQFYFNLTNDKNSKLMNMTKANLYFIGRHIYLLTHLEWIARNLSQSVVMD